MSATVLQGDCRTLMAAMDEASIDSIVTDPPYGLSREPDPVEVLTHWLAGDDYEHRGNGFMGNSWDSFVPGPATWKEAYRVLKPGGFLLAFFSTRTFDLGCMAIRLAGFEIRDMVDWLYGSGFPKGGLDDEGRGACLKPAHEPIVMARKPFKGSADANVARWGAGKLNIDACRIVSEPGRAWREGESRAGHGIYGNGVHGSRAIQGGTDLGRWPANVIHDGSDCVVAGFPETSSGRLRAGTGDQGKGAGVYGKYAGRVVGQDFGGDTGSAARFFYCAKASKADRDEGLEHLDPQAFVQFQTGNGESGKASSLSAGRDTQYRNPHPTVKPEGLMRYLPRLVTPAGGTILDPFCGSGSTGKAAVLEGYGFIGCEITPEYVPIARARIAAAEARVEAEGASASRAQIEMFQGEAA